MDVFFIKRSQCLVPGARIKLFYRLPILALRMPKIEQLTGRFKGCVTQEAARAFRPLCYSLQLFSDTIIFYLDS